METHIKKFEIVDETFAIDFDKEIEKLREENPDFCISKKGVSYTESHAILSYSKIPKGPDRIYKRARPGRFGG
jgi:hypothetical protein